jgi:molybdate transport system substrate-binding protein
MPPSTLKLLSSMATRGLLSELALRYQRACGQAVEAEAAGGVDVARRVQAGESVDVVVLASNAIDKLIEQARLLSGSRVDLVKSGVAVAVRAGAAKPEIASEEALRRAVLAARSLSYSTGPSGVHLEKTFERWGIMAQIRPRIVVPPPGVPVGSLIADGSVELGFQQLSELATLPGVEVLGPLPPPIQTTTIFSGAVSIASSQAPAARALLLFMASPEIATVKQQFGMETAQAT